MVVLVGGHSRGVGKTAVIAGLIAACPEAGWTAVKVTPHRHGAGGEGSDTGRYLAAGARSAFLVECNPAALAAVLPAGGNALVESTSTLEFLQPDLYLAVLDFAVAEFKPSARRWLDRADALVVVDRGALTLPWPGIVLPERPRFVVRPPGYTDPALVEMVRRRLG